MRPMPVFGDRPAGHDHRGQRRSTGGASLTAVTRPRTRPARILTAILEERVALAGVLIFGASMLPWYGVTYLSDVGDYDLTLSAWSASWVWTVAIVLALGAVCVWIFYRERNDRVPVLVRAITLMLVGAAIGFVVWQGGVFDRPEPTSSAADMLIDRGFEVGTRWGYTAGLVALSLLALAILTAGAGVKRRH
jgi:hypothetical protein